MNRTAQRYLRAGRAGSLTTLLVAMGFVPVLCTANPRAIAKPDTAVAAVSVADLDLSTQDGARTARRRLQVAAVRLCRAFSDSRRIADVATLGECSRDALADALRRVNALNALASVPAPTTPAP